MALCEFKGVQAHRANLTRRIDDDFRGPEKERPRKAQLQTM
jgi:hypothetical protein